jgi:hypothetical protein
MCRNVHMHMKKFHFLVMILLVPYVNLYKVVKNRPSVYYIVEHIKGQWIQIIINGHNNQHHRFQQKKKKKKY